MKYKFDGTVEMYDIVAIRKRKVYKKYLNFYYKKKLQRIMKEIKFVNKKKVRRIALKFRFSEVIFYKGVGIDGKGEVIR